MNLFGLSIGLSSNSNGKYVKREECHNAQRAIKDSITSLESFIDKRCHMIEALILKQQ